MKELNVFDYLKQLTVPEIGHYCAARAISAAVAMTQIEGDFNFSTIIRNANFFGFREVFYIGAKRWDRRGSVGAHHYTPIKHFKNEQDFLESEDVSENVYTLIALENNVNLPLENIYSFIWPRNPMILIGEERNGIPFSLLTKCKKIVTIPSEGCIRSLNAGTAAGIAMAMIRQFMAPKL